MPTGELELDVVLSLRQAWLGEAHRHQVEAEALQATLLDVVTSLLGSTMLSMVRGVFTVAEAVASLLLHCYQSL